MARSSWVSNICGILIVAAAACLVFTPAMTGKAGAEVVKLTFNDHNPGPSTVAKAWDDWEEWVEKESDGKVQINLVHGGSLLKEKDAYRGIQKGVADGGHYVLNRQQGFTLNTVITLPFMRWPGRDKAVQIYRDLREEFPELREEWKGIKIIGTIMMPPTGIHTKDTVVKTPEDLKGMKLMGAEHAMVQLIDAAGATAVNLDIGDMYMSLDRGLIQGVMNHVAVLDVFGVLELLEHHTVFGEGGLNMTPMFNVMNQESFDKLPPDVQDLLEESGRVWAEKQMEWDKKSLAKAWGYCKENDHKITRLNPEQIKEWQELIQEPIYEKWIEENEKQGKPGREVFDRAEELAGKYR